jgi:hypothetical protein
MSRELRVVVTGGKELVAALRTLDAKIQQKVGLKAMREALTPMKMTAKAKAPMGKDAPWGAENGEYKGAKHPGFLKSKFSITKGRGKPGLLLVSHMRNDAYTALWVEYGHKIVRGGRKNKGNQRVVGYVPPRPFMRPAFDLHAPKTVDLFVARIKVFIAKYRV